jgi:hypothetical protein
MNYILEYQKKNPDKYLLLDSDMFLISDFDINKYAQYQCAIVLQSRNDDKINYFWNGIYYFDFTSIKNIDLLDWNNTDICDVGGMMHDWLKLQMSNKYIPTVDEICDKNKSYNTDNVYFITHLRSCNWNEKQMPNTIHHKLYEFIKNDVRNVNGNFFCELFDDVFLHYRAGGNWLNHNMNLHYYLTKQLKDCLL